MKRSTFFERTSDVLDAYIVRERRLRSWSHSPSKWIFALSTLAVILSAVWWTYAIQLKPSRDQKLVDEAIAILQTNPKMADWSAFTSTWSNERKLINLSRLVGQEDAGLPSALRAKASRAALDLAIHDGSKEARLALGKALRDGDLGKKDPQAALAEFKTLLGDLQPGIQAGDHDALYVYSLMLKEGLGVEIDTAKARDILKRVAMTRENSVMQGIGRSAVFGAKEDRDLELAKAISRKLIDNGHPESYVLGSLACAEEHRQNRSEIEQVIELTKLGNQSELRPLLAKIDLRAKELAQCRRPFVEAAAKKGDKDAVEELASRANDTVAQPTKAQQPSPAEDTDSQANTGYLIGTKQLAKGGHSTFKVDNTKGGGDAVVRLYLGGKLPAARTIFLKNGESFVAEAVAPGAYRLRYRYIGNTDTFEAEETFNLTESRTETGVRFSRVTVTLYKVANGNMTVKKVSASEF